MWWWQAVLAALCAVAPVRADVESAVRVLSQYNQLVTSSTLLWVEARGGAPPEHAVEAGADAVVCRVLADGVWVPGALRAGACDASAHGRAYRLHDFQVLQNVEDGGRLRWQRWDRFQVLGTGTVAAGDDKMFVARREPGQVCRLDGSLGLLGKIVVLEPDGVQHEYEEGEVLVETEPTSYELDDVVLQQTRARAHRERVTLGAATLRNDEPDAGAAPSRVDAVIAYGHNTTVGWGHGHAVLTGHTVSVRLRDGSELEPFRWAVDHTTEGKAVYQVEAQLPPGLACNVTLVANWTEANVPYEGRLTAVYADGERRVRPLTGVRREIGLRDVRPEFGPLYNLADGTLVPTTTTSTTTTTAAPSTTTSASTTSTSTTGTSSVPPDPMKKRPATNSTEMQADGPPARDSSGNGAASLASNLVMCALVVVVALVPVHGHQCT